MMKLRAKARVRKTEYTMPDEETITTYRLCLLHYAVSSASHTCRIKTALYAWVTMTSHAALSGNQEGISEQECIGSTSNQVQRDDLEYC
jgi:hypothetical protein